MAYATFINETPDVSINALNELHQRLYFDKDHVSMTVCVRRHVPAQGWNQGRNVATSDAIGWSEIVRASRS